MQTRLKPELLASDAGQHADRILRACVHCGFCLATCPSYQVLGNEMDSPRGRIHLIRELLEGTTDGKVARTHLDRCLTCRACETTCPSGVAYGQLLEVGRAQVEARGVRPVGSRLLRLGLRWLVPRRWLLRSAIRLGGLVRWMLPRSLRRRIPKLRNQLEPKLPSSHPRRVLLLGGCVQRAVTPDVNERLVQLLDGLGITAVSAVGEGCCGALPLHLGAGAAAAQVAARNVDALWPWVATPVEAIISTASGCGVTVRDYGRLLADDPQRAAKARQIAAMTVDVAEFLAAEELSFERPAGVRVAFHPPCSLQHGLGVVGVAERLLTAAGYQLVAVADTHLCCGSAGTYSILQHEVSDELGRRKAAALMQGQPTVVATANIGCELQLGAYLPVPVVHWLELLDRAVPHGRATPPR